MTLNRYKYETLMKCNNFYLIVCYSETMFVVVLYKKTYKGNLSGSKSVVIYLCLVPVQLGL